MNVSCRSERVFVIAGVTVVAALGSAHLFVAEPGEAVQWSAEHGWIVFGMWAAMMVAIMIPAAAPALLACAGSDRRGEGAAGYALPAFLAGHVAVWTCISGAAALAHWSLHAAELLVPGTAVASPAAGGILLISAGAYLLTPLRAACLATEGRPTGFLPGEWRDGAGGAFVMGLRRAMHCVGRCWILMAMLFVGGVMSPLWIVVLTPIVVAERILPFGQSVAHGVAAGAIGWGLWMLAGMLA